MKNETNLNVERFNGVDVLKIMEMIKKPSTNFDRITESPEKLARWIFETMDFCSRGCSNCPIKEKCLSSDSKGTEMNLLEWLNEEYKK